MLFIIPAKNESATIAAVVLSCKKFGDVLVVDDNSNDGTCDIAELSGARIIHNLSGGYSGGIYDGIEYARVHGFLSCITVDADGEHPFQSISAVYSKLTEGFDLVVGRRPAARRIAERIYNYLYSFKFGISLDYCCGLKGYRIDKLEDKNIGYQDKCGNKHFFEMLNIKNVSCGECEIVINDRKNDSRFGGILSGNYKILKTICKR